MHSINPLRRLSVLLLLPLLFACDEDALTPRELVGAWEFTSESTSTEGWRRDDILLTLQPDGGLVRAHSTFADDGRPVDHLRAFARVDGTYRVRGDSLIVEITRVERWSDPQPDPEVQNPSTYAEERYRARLIANLLVLEETRLVDGEPVTYHHAFRRLAETDNPNRPGR
jgi:hypothetical protein